MLATLWHEFRYAARSLSRTPGFAFAAIVTIALGVGVNTGIFSVLNGVLFRDLPAPDPHELVSIRQTVEDGAFTGRSGEGSFTLAEFRAYRERVRTLTDVLALGSPRETTLGGETPQRISGSIVSCNYFAVLETPPVRGRALTADDCAPGANPVVVLGHELWTTVFDANPDILGQIIELERNPFMVVGVAAEGTFGGSPLRTSYFAPLSTEPLLWPGQSRFEDERFLWLYMLGRRVAGTSIDQVRAELGVIAAQIDQAEPGRTTTLTIGRATPAGTMPPELQGVATGAAVVLIGAFGLILLIACANVANLLLARGTTRIREIGIRLSLGASRARIVRQLLAESLLIAVAGGLLGSLLALWSFQSLFAIAVPALIPPEVPAFMLELDFSPDFRVLWYAFVMTLATGVLFGLAPALHISRTELNTVIKQDVGGVGDRSGGRLRGALVGTQVALGMVLMIATGLMLRGLQATYTIEPGFGYENVAHLSFGTDGGPGEILDQRLMDEVAALPGVESVAFATQTPLGEARMTTQIRLPDESEDASRAGEWDLVTADYFSLLGIPVLRGRTFTQAEIANAGDSRSRPAIVSETTARNLWGETDPIGRTLIRQAFQQDPVTLEVVGVVADAQLVTLGRIEPYYLFEPRQPGGELLVRSRTDLDSLVTNLRAIVQARDPSLAFRVLPIEGNLGYFRGLSGVITTLFSGLGLLALVLASVGIYGVVAYAVARRYREIGIRMALGARPRNVLGLVLRRIMRPVAIGAVAGFVAAIGVSRVLSLVLFGVSPADPLGLGGSALLVLGIAIAAGALAARPAIRTEPTSVLRYE